MRRPQLLMRADAGAEMGTGHVMRCRALAWALRRRGWGVSFVVRELTSLAAAALKADGVECIQLGYAAGSRDKGLPYADVEQTMRVARERLAEGVIVDHYGAGPEYLGELKGAGLRVGVIDDVADRDLRAAQWLLNQNLGASSLAYRLAPDCAALLGPDYALLRPEFLRARSRSRRPLTEDDNRVLITLGGGDNYDLCREILAALEEVRRSLQVRVVLGGVNGEAKEKWGRDGGWGHQVEFFWEVHDMTEHMLWADLSINAGGSTCWELCCLGVPMIVMVRSRDQQLIATHLEGEGCARNLGWWEGHRTAGLLREWVMELLQAAERRAGMSLRGRRLIDGRGAVRAAASWGGRSRCGEVVL